VYLKGLSLANHTHTDQRGSKTEKVAGVDWSPLREMPSTS